MYNRKYGDALFVEVLVLAVLSRALKDHPGQPYWTVQFVSSVMACYTHIDETTNAVLLILLLDCHRQLTVGA